MDQLFRDKNHVDWVRAWIQVLTDLQVFVKQHHTTGLVWNAKGTQNSKEDCHTTRRVVDRLLA